MVKQKQEEGKHVSIANSVLMLMNKRDSQHMARPFQVVGK